MGYCIPYNKKDDLISSNIPNKEYTSKFVNNSKKNDTSLNNNENNYPKNSPITTNINNINININKITQPDIKSSETNREKNIKQAEIIKPN